MSLEDTADMLLEDIQVVVDTRMKLIRYPNGDYKVHLHPSPVSVDACHVLATIFAFAACKNAEQGWDIAIKAITDEIEKMRITTGTSCNRELWPGW